MRLGEAQELFMLLLPRLLDFMHAEGYQVRGGELKRDERVAELNAQSGAGISTSLHLDALAIDLHLFRDGKYLTDTADHSAAGKYWKSLHPLCRWGGDFQRQDGNHYSIEFQGRQ